MMEEQCEHSVRTADPRKMAAEGNGHTSDALRQPPAHWTQTSIMQALYHHEARIKKLENEMIEKRDWFSYWNNKLQHLQSPNRTLLEGVTKIGDQHKEENEKLKEKIKKLEARYEELLFKTMAMHKNSEDMNDPSNLSAVLRMYEMLQLCEWEKVWSSTSCWTYEQGSRIIKKLFDACEEEIQQRTAAIFKVLDFPPSNNAMTNSKQRIMQEIKNLFGQPYYQSHSEVYNRIVMKAVVHVENDIQRQFVLQCCQIYCLLLLQDPPVKAEWNIKNISTQYLEHVDRKDVVHWKKPLVLWPVMKCEGKLVVKGVVCDKKQHDSEPSYTLPWP